MIDLDSDPNPLRKIPIRVAPSPAANIGGTLRQARTKKGHSLELVGQHTRIQKKFLESLEANRFEDFPAMVYARSFLKTYCEYLEIDFEALWRQAFPEPEPGAGTQHPLQPQAPTGESVRPAGRQGQPAPRLGVGLLITAGFACLAIYALRPEGNRRGIESTGAPSPPNALAPLAPAPEPDLVIEFQGEAYVRVLTDGELRFEGRVPLGTRQEWKARREISLKTSDSTALSLTLNGSPYTLPPPGPAGDYRIEGPR